MVRIVGVETFCAEDLAVVRVCTEDGQEGWGQVAPYHADITALVVHRQVAPHVLGQDDGDLAALGERVMEREHKFPGSIWSARWAAWIPRCGTCGASARAGPCAS